ncbi:MAG: phosphonate ABC transporter substrate-binding protein [Deltaproteobacteria bacterium]|jgi:phosphonate transport system substrate-binding protein|nr:phosphonate ABC transporter substrate-binding protein [Deltaproteobacteria bacterium]
MRKRVISPISKKHDLFGRLAGLLVLGFGLVLAWGLGLATTGLAQAQEINFGIISTESSQNLRKLWDPFLDDMRKETGLDVKAFFASDYAGIIEGMRFNKVQLAWYGNKSAMEAVDRADGEVFMQTLAADGSQGYYSHIIANVNSPLNSIEDMFKDAKNLNFGNGDPNSTSGFLVPSYYVFAVNGVDPKTAFKRTLSSNHESNALSVANGQVDVATNNSESLDRLELTAPDKRKQIKVIWTSPLIPSDPLVWRKDLDPAVKKKIQDFLLNYGKDGDERKAEILTALQWKGFKSSSDDQLLPIRQLELFKEKKNLEDRGNLNDEQKTRLTQINNELKDLETKMASLAKS